MVTVSLIIWTDTDGDGIVDAVDVDITGGTDADGDGIDDFADTDFVDLTDSDGDGIVDLFDDDFLGTGFLPFNAVGGAVVTAELPDGNNNDLADVYEPSVVGNPGAAEEEPSGKIRTGLAGNGCSVSVASDKHDPLLALLVVVASLVMIRRRRV